MSIPITIINYSTREGKAWVSGCTLFFWKFCHPIILRKDENFRKQRNCEVSFWTITWNNDAHWRHTLPIRMPWLSNYSNCKEKPSRGKTVVTFTLKLNYIWCLFAGTAIVRQRFVLLVFFCWRHMIHNFPLQLCGCGSTERRWPLFFQLLYFRHLLQDSC